MPVQKSTIDRKSVSINVARTLWAQCGGFCQKQGCQKPLFRSVGEDIVSVANVAHIIGHGGAGPRSGHELAQHIEKDGLDNLIMLCLDCHKEIDELEQRFTVEQIQGWKRVHAEKISSIFSVPRIVDEKILLSEVNDLLDQNGTIFREYGPYSQAALHGEGGDSLKIWRKRCLDTILPNNQRIISLIEQNKRNFAYPWDVYVPMLMYKMHADAFQDNCLTDQKVNDYKLFPRSFDHFVKTKLGIPSLPPELVEREGLEYRNRQIKTLIDKFLVDHNSIASSEELNRGTMLLELKDGRSLKVFVTNTYYFTDYSLDRVLEIDPAVSAIICASPYGQYSSSAKRECIKNRIGLFMLGEFMGAIRHTGEQYLNYLLRSDRNSRVLQCVKVAKESAPPEQIHVFVFGSFLRQALYRDVDFLVVYKEPQRRAEISEFENRLSANIRRQLGEPDITVSSDREFSNLKLKYDNLTKVYP